MTDYLPKDATIEQACQWLRAKTGQTWILPRLLECHLTPYFGLYYKPGYPALYSDRIEGYQTRMMFHSDICRLESDGADALVNMFAAHDGSLVKIEPGMRVPLSDLRFKRDDVERVAEIINQQKTAPATPAPVVAAKAATVGKATDKTATNWRMKIQAEAYEHWIRLLASGCSPTPHSILDYLATWCATNNVRTDTGIYPRAGYIKNTAINGKLWTPPNISREQAKKQVAQVAQTNVAQVAQ